MTNILHLFEVEGGAYTDRVSPGCERVLRGAGQCWRLWGGLPCKIERGTFFCHRDNRWLPVGAGPEDALHVQGWSLLQQWKRADETVPDWLKPHLRRFLGLAVPDWTWTLCGPGIAGNPEGFDRVILLPDRCVPVHPPSGLPMTPADLASFCAGAGVVGLVWESCGRLVQFERRLAIEPPQFKLERDPSSALAGIGLGSTSGEEERAETPQAPEPPPAPTESRRRRK